MIIHRCIAATFAALSIGVTMDAVAQRIGYIETIQGTVFLKTEKGVVRRLSSAHDLARLVDERDRVRAEKGGWIRLQTGSELLKVMPRNNWTAIRRGTKAVPPQVAQALAEYGRVGGRSRSFESNTHAHAIAPVSGSLVAARRFAIEVVPGTKDCPLTVELRNMNREVLWSVTDHHASAHIDSGPARGVLAGLQSAAERVRLEFEVIGECAESKIKQFKLLSRGEEAALEQELKAWDEITKDWLLLRFGRASVFAVYEMYPEVAAAYEEALTAAPESIDLLARTIEAHDRIGNVGRKAELVRQLNEIDPPED